MNYLIVENDEVVNIIVADSVEIAVELTGKEVIEAIENVPGLGWIRSNGEWSNPNYIEPQIAESNTIINENDPRTELEENPTE